MSKIRILEVNKNLAGQTQDLLDKVTNKQSETQMQLKTAKSLEAELLNRLRKKKDAEQSEQISEPIMEIIEKPAEKAVEKPAEPVVKKEPAAEHAVKEDKPAEKPALKNPPNPWKRKRQK